MSGPAGSNGARWPSMAWAVADYLLGFFAIAIFAAYAFGQGKPDDNRWQHAFLIGAGLAVIEIGLLLWRRAPANRLILCLNGWLIAGGVAVMTEQWWWLRWYDRLGEASMFLAMLAGGLLFTLMSPAGFVGVAGDARAVRRASWWLMAGAAAALGMSLAYRGDTRFAAVLPIIALSWFNRLLSRWVRSANEGATRAGRGADSIAPVTSDN